MNKKHIVILLETYSLITPHHEVSSANHGVKLSSIAAVCVDMDSKTMTSQFEANIDQTVGTRVLASALKQQHQNLGVWEYQHNSGVGISEALASFSLWLSDCGENATLWCGIDELDKHKKGRDVSVFNMPSSTNLTRTRNALGECGDLFDHAHVISCVDFGTDTKTSMDKLMKQLKHFAFTWEVATASHQAA